MRKVHLFYTSLFIILFVLVMFDFSFGATATNLTKTTKPVPIPAKSSTPTTTSNKVTPIPAPIVPKPITTTPISKPVDDQATGGGVVRSAVLNAPAPSCIDNYNTWRSSGSEKVDASWSTLRIPTRSYTTDASAFVDLNGDGLTDFIYAYRRDDIVPARRESCVLLNNGKGWDVVFKCVYNGTFYGDCAQ